MRGWQVYVGVMVLAAANLSLTTLAHGAAPVVNPPSSIVSVAPPPAAADKVATLEARVAKLELLLQSQVLADMLVQLTKLQEEMQRLNGVAELHAHEIDGINKRQRDAYLDIDRRLREIEKGLAAREASPRVDSDTEKGTVLSVPSGTPAVAVSPPQASASVKGSAPATKVLDAPREQVMYQRALDALKAGRHDQAITDFQEFLVQYGKSDFASNAYYWLGEANYATRRYEAAATHFRKIIDAYPDSNKVADSRLKLGFTHYEMGEREQARKILNEVVSLYPNTRAAQLANERLQKIKSDSR